MQLIRVCKLHFPDVLSQIIHKKQDQDAIRSAELYGYLACGQIPIMGYLTVHVHVIVLAITASVCPVIHGTHLLLNRCVHNL